MRYSPTMRMSFFFTLALILAGGWLREVVDAIVRARRNDAPVIAGIGGGEGQRRDLEQGGYCGDSYTDEDQAPWQALIEDPVDDQLHEDGLWGRKLRSTQSSGGPLIQDDDETAYDVAQQMPFDIDF